MDRIAYLKTRTAPVTEDIPAFRALSREAYDAVTDMPEIFRKAHFLSRMADTLPVEMDARELIVGSMRWARNALCGRNMGHIIPDYRTVLRLGVGGMLEKIHGLRTPDAPAFREAVEAFSRFIRRHGEKAAELGITEVSRICTKLSANAPESFWEALQLVWFVHLFLHAEGLAAAVSFGRFDVYLEPFYQRDIRRGILTREAAKELLCCFWLKTCEGDESQNLTLGGDQETELTFLCMEVTREMLLPQPSISVRVCESTSEALWKEILALVKCGIGMPAVMNDRAVIPAPRHLGICPEDAENYAVVGCYEANPDGKTFGSTACAGAMRLHEILLRFLDKSAEYADYPAFYRAFLEYFAAEYKTVIHEEFRANWKRIREERVSPFQSACMGGCLESGVAAELGGCEYTMSGINILGIGTLTDSLYVMKKLVFEEKVCSYGEFTRQVRENFPDRELMRRCRNLPGKYGIDNPETNAMAGELSRFIADLVDAVPMWEGVTPYAGLFIFLGDIRADQYPATPDGRLRGEKVSYGVGASDICGGKSITSVLNHAAHIAHDRFADGNPLMLFVSKQDIAGEKGDALLRALMESYFVKGGFHLQVNVTSADLLREARQNPEAHEDLLIRISGYSDYFTRLDTQLQDALIERT